MLAMIEYLPKKITFSGGSKTRISTSTAGSSTVQFLPCDGQTDERTKVFQEVLADLKRLSLGYELLFCLKLSELGVINQLFTKY